MKKERQQDKQRSTKHYTINNKQQEHLNKKIKTTEGENTRRKKTCQ